MEIAADVAVAAGKTIGVSVLPCAGGAFAEVAWSQVSGPPAEITASRNPTIALETSAPGVVRIRADGQYTDGRTASVTADITVTDAPAGSYVTVRGDHAVKAGSSTSVRAWPVLRNGETVSGVSWTQVAGPAVAIDASRPNLLMFAAPAVAADTVLKFRATMTTSSGHQDSDEVSVGVERVAALPRGAYFEQPVARVYPYRAAGTYAGALRSCVYDPGLYWQSSSNNNFCWSQTLPLLEAEAGPGGVPSVAQVMGRVLVSHDYLGANFEQFLQAQDPHGDFRRLLAGATAIVIGSHVRPSHYTSATGAIYLDANYLWLTPAQRDIVTEVPDYRTAFGAQLSFAGYWRLVKNNANANRSFPATERHTRTADELVYGLGRLLYHELAHAGDFFAPSARSLSPSQPLWSSASSRINARSLPSDLLAQRYPLVSSEMFGLGQVWYWGAPANAAQKAYTATDAGHFFAADRATNDYAYSRSGTSNSREDIAMLFEEFMMGHRHGVQYDMAFANRLVDGMTGSDLIVAWGQRGRIAEAAIRPRIKLALEHIAPWIDPAAVDALPAPVMMRPGVSWTGNLVLGATPGTRQSARMVETPAQQAQRLRDELNRPRH